uniref:AAA family ATPase n=1 Tax=[Eubacterium] hominis TaxID=2764325 RepID=UPI0023DD68EB
LCQTYEELKKGNNFSNVVFIKNSLNRLIEFLSKKYQKNVIFLIDEYDTPFMSALTGKYYENVKDLLTGMLSSALKDNEYLYKGVLTGIQRIAKENLFSGLNNLEVCSIQDEKYKDVFGFTEDETRTLLEAHHLELNQDVKEMYDGYTIGGTEIYNPWSVINYADKGVLASYWINTGSNEVVCQLLEKSSNKVKKQYIELLEKGEMKVNCILEGAYIELRGATQLWALLVHAGYLTIKAKVSFDEYVLRIVNGEVKQDLWLKSW